MKYKCLVLDHDDTIVSSTAEIHYPCFVEYLKETRPHLVGEWTLERYFVENFHPGITAILRDGLGMDEEELQCEYNYWAEYVKNHIPAAFPGIREIIEQFRARGGIIAVNSHSYRKYIERDFRHNGLPAPDEIYSWDLPEEQRKPSPYTLFQLMDKYSFAPSEVLVVDDLKPGYDMARGAGVDFAAAGWAHDIPEISDFMSKYGDYYLKDTASLSKILF